jgi:hypothetical protein
LHDGLLVVTARLDLPDIDYAALDNAVAAMVRGGSSSFIAALYDDTARTEIERSRWYDLVDRIDDDAIELDCELLDVLLVAADRWWSLLCDSAECCPDAGSPIPSEPSAFTAAATVDGVVALPDRAALERLLEPLPANHRAVLGAAIASAEAHRDLPTCERELLSAAAASEEPGWGGVPDDDVARFLAGLARSDVRDAMWSAIDAEGIDGRPLWRELARRAPAPYDAPPLFLFGWAAWRAGDGALAGIAAERAIESDPGYTHADLLLATLSAGLNPRQVPRIRFPRSA